jgi:hypothetical protein
VGGREGHSGCAVTQFFHAELVSREACSEWARINVFIKVAKEENFISGGVALPEKQ